MDVTQELEKFKNYYTNLFSHNELKNDKYQEQIKEKVLKIYLDTKDKKYDYNITEIDIENALKSLKANKAVGNDKICNEMFKYGDCGLLKRFLSKIYNDIINFGINVKNLNISLITPIPKGNQQLTPNDSRPISVSNSFSTIYEKIILNKSDKIFKFSKNQFGYQNKASCKHASFLIKEINGFYNSGGSSCFIISLDLSKAFDRMCETS